jgi:hypothetical protein
LSSHCLDFFLGHFKERKEQKKKEKNYEKRRDEWTWLPYTSVTHVQTSNGKLPT